MKITRVLVDVVAPGERAAALLPASGRTRGRTPRIVPVGNSRRLRYTHEWLETARPVFEEHELYLRVQTDEGIEGVCTCSSPELTPRDAEILRTSVVGLDPLRREELYQRLHLGTRWVYRPPGWFGNFDNCLWDIAGKVRI